MLFKKFQMVAQIVGCVTIALLAIYGLLTVLSGDSPVWAAIGQSQAATLASQDIPSTFNYQGFLREPDGSLATGSYTITARIYDLAKGGTALYTTTVQNVTVRDGLFNIVLGERPSMSAEAFSDVPRFIGISLKYDRNGYPEELIPRQRIHAVPWALTAKTLVSNAVVDGIASTNDIVVSTGDIVVQSGQLDVNGDANVGGQLDVTGDANVSGQLAVTGAVQIGNIMTSNLNVSGTITIKDQAPIIIKRFENIPDSVITDTGISSLDYYCVATGWSAQFDYQESGALPNYVWTYVVSPTWWVAVQFPSHIDDEEPDVDVVCFRKEIVEWQGADVTLFDPD
jgi:hypothetical protein